MELEILVEYSTKQVGRRYSTLYKPANSWHWYVYGETEWSNRAEIDSGHSKSRWLAKRTARVAARAYLKRQRATEAAQKKSYTTTIKL